VQYPPRLVPGDRFPANVAELLQVLPFARAYVNSLMLACIVMICQVFFSSLAGFAFAKYDFPGRHMLFMLLLATVMIPPVVGLVPWYIMMSWFGWIDSYQALIVPNMASAFAIFWIRQYISQSVPDEMIQAARVDGASDFGIYARLVVPIVLPGLGVLGIVAFLNTWNDYLAPLVILRNIQKFTLPLILALLQNQYNNRLHLVMTGSTLATVPVLLVFFLASKQFIKGLSAGAIKG
jgi:ABC-type glycerol-3-phosphate transport system permease component